MFYGVATEVWKNIAFAISLCPKIGDTAEVVNT